MLYGRPLGDDLEATSKPAKEDMDLGCDSWSGFGCLRTRFHGSFGEA